jgi:propanediol dehydratase small subunit
MTFDPSTDYPIGTARPDLVSTPGGVPLAEVTLSAVRAGTIDRGDLRATAETLRLQAAVALAAGRPQLAENLERAAELAGVPDDLLLAVYGALRPGRATGAELEQWAERLEGFRATATAALVREAAAAYADRGLLANG